MIILIVFLVCAAILIIFLIKRNLKDKDDFIETLNAPEIEDKPRKEDVLK